jgi:hypothetical protein
MLKDLRIHGPMFVHNRKCLQKCCWVAVLSDYNAISISAQVFKFSVSPLGCKSSCNMLIKSWRNDSYQSQVKQYVAWQKGQNQKWGRGMFVRERRYVHLRLKLNCTYCFSHRFQASWMEWQCPHDRNKLLWAARNGELQKFKTLVDTLTRIFRQVQMHTLKMTRHQHSISMHQSMRFL